MPFVYLLPLFFFGVLLASPAVANQVQALQSQIDQIKTMQAAFTQEQRNAKGELRRESSGYFYLKRPGQFYWHYQKPHEQQLIAAQDVLWVYEPDLMQATRSALSANQGAPIAILLDDETIETVFHVDRQPLSGEDELDWFVLDPKEQAGDFQQLQLAMDADGLREMVFIDQLGHRTEVSFSEREFNLPLDDSLFTFSPPDGVDVVESSRPGVN